MGKEKSEEFKQFESLDKQYGKDRSAQKILEADKATMQRLTLAVLDAQDKLNAKKSENAKAAAMSKKAPNSKDDMKKAEDEVKKAVKDLEEHRKKLKDALDKVNTRFEELGKNPEMKKQLDAILVKRMDRTIKQRQKDLEGYKQIKEIFEKHPHSANLVKSVVNNKKEIARLDKIIEAIEKIPDASRTPKQQKELADSKTARTTAENNIIARKSDLDVFLHKNYQNLPKETVTMMYDLNTVNVNRVIKGAEKDIAKRERAYKELTGKDYKLVAQKEEKEGKTGDGKNAPLPAKVGIWSKFKNWFSRYWNGTEMPKEDAKEESKKEKGKKKETSEFRDAYKYDIVKDYIAQKESDLLKNKPVKGKDNKQKDDEGR